MTNIKGTVKFELRCPLKITVPFLNRILFKESIYNLSFGFGFGKS